ncbi:MAG TPA: hypothetical protein VLJ37_02130 [bacterium]|nr:hypothetical protein [bacterium]
MDVNPVKIMSSWDFLKIFVKEGGPELAVEVAKKLSPATAQALRHAVYLTEEGVKPWVYKAAERVRFRPGEVRTMIESIRLAARNPEVQKAAAGGGGTTAAAMGLATLLKAPVGTAFGAAPIASSVLVSGAGLAGYGLGTLLDHAVGWIRDDGRSLTDLISGANAGVPVADPTCRGGTGWRFVPDAK